MNLLTVAIPCYNSQDYMSKAVESALAGGPEVEILIVNDGSADDTARIADEYADRYPNRVRAIHKENGGHGDAVMTGLREATGIYFKVLDSDDWLDEDAWPQILETLRRFSGTEKPLDMLVSNYVYDKEGSRHKHSMNFRRTFPQGQVFSWEESRRFRKGQYLLMHSVIYRTGLLKETGLELPKHTFYVDELFVYVPLKDVKRICYLDTDFYHYYIGREGQSVQEKVMLKRIDQALKVNKLLISEVDPYQVPEIKKRKYMLNYLEIVTTTSMVLLTKRGTKEDMHKKKELWHFISENNPQVYRELKTRLIGILLNLPGKTGKPILISGYKISQKIFGFN